MRMPYPSQTLTLLIGFISVFLLLGSLELFASPHHQRVSDVEIQTIGIAIDTVIRSGHPADSFANDDILWIGRNDPLGEGIQRGLLQFDLSTIDAEKTIESAELLLYSVGTTTNDQPRSISVCPVLDTWDATITWNRGSGLTCDSSSRPTPRTVDASTLITHTWDISSFVRQWISDTTTDNSKFSLLVQGEEAPGEHERGFASSECVRSNCIGHSPRLMVTLRAAPKPSPSGTPELHSLHLFKRTDNAARSGRYGDIFDLFPEWNSYPNQHCPDEHCAQPT